jgi:hypothetical protein
MIHPEASSFCLMDEDIPKFSLINYLTIISKAGGVVFYGVIDFRAPSFPDLSVGEAAARQPLLASGNEEGAKVPPGISSKKRPARSALPSS